MLHVFVYLFAIIQLIGCGRFLDKDKDEEPQSQDAIAEDSDIKWDTAVPIEGVLLHDPSRTSRYKYTYEKSLTLIMNQDANMKIKVAETSSTCPAGSEFGALTFSLSSNDGLFIRSTDTIDQYVQPTSQEIFPGRIPAGIHTLKIRVYGSGGCRFMSSFSFPNPDGDHNFPASTDNIAIDSDLTGTWHMSESDRGIEVDTTWSFGSDRTLTYTMVRGDVKRAQYTGKYQLDSSATPKRIRIIVSSVAVSQFAGVPSAGDVLRCIYLPTPKAASTQLYWQCSEPQNGGFPIDFSPLAEEYERSGAVPGTFPDFDVVKGGDTNLLIPDNDLDGLIHSFEVTAEVSSVVDLGIQFRINHTQPSDIRVALVHPDGTSVLLYEREQSSSQTISKTFGYNGTRLASLDAFKGKSLNGKWKLHVSDEVVEDTGSLYFAKLFLRGKY